MRKIKQILINEKNKDDGLLLEREILRKKKRKNTESKNRNKNVKGRWKKEEITLVLDHPDLAEHKNTIRKYLILIFNYLYTSML